MFAWKIEISCQVAEKNEIFRKFAWKNRFFSEICLHKRIFCVKLPEKTHIFWKFAWKNPNFCYPDPRPPRFQTRLTPLVAAPARCSWQGIGRSSVASTRAVKISLYITLVLTPLTATAEVFLPGYLPWHALVFRLHCVESQNISFR